MITGKTIDGNPATIGVSLTQHHLDDLRKSGLTDETIRRCGFYSVRTPAVVGKLLGWGNYKGSLGDCLAIPYMGRDGKPTGYVRLKPSTPRVSKNGKPIKYESPKGSTNRAYFPPNTIAALETPITETSLITEGEKKSITADQAGYPCIGLPGVYGWQKKRDEDEHGNKIGKRELIDDLAAINWAGVNVVIVFDSDAVRNPMVRRAEWHLAEALRERGAIVRIARLPDGEPGPDGQPVKVGLDDFLVAHLPIDLQKIIDDAKEATPPTADETGPNESVDNPTRLAREFLEAHCTHPDGLTLRFWGQEAHIWDGSAFRQTPIDELNARLYQFIQSQFEDANRRELAEWEAAVLADPKLKRPVVRKITHSLLNSVILALSAKCILPASKSAPFWIEGDDRDIRNLLVCRNGFVDLAKLAVGNTELSPPTPRLFSPFALDYDFDGAAPEATAWLTFLHELFNDDVQSIELLQEWFGYCLTPNTSQQKILMIVGPKRSGKGTIGRVIRSVIGPDNVAGPTLAGLGTQFGLWPLIGKNVAIVSDARLSGRTDSAIVTERLLSISGEDAQTIDRKNLQPITMKLPTRFMIFSNELPRLNDASGALAGRILLLRLSKSFYGAEDTALSDKLITERAGILWWALAGWRRLTERRHFIQPDASRELLQDLEDLSSPIGAFIRERCILSPAARTDVDLIYQAWVTWCTNHGRKEPGTAQIFGRDLSAAVPGLKRVRPRDGNDRIRAYEGIGLRVTV